MCGALFGGSPRVQSIAPPPRTEDLTDPTKGADGIRRAKKRDRGSTILTGAEGVLQPSNVAGAPLLGGIS
jgi:hypothetical protein